MIKVHFGINLYYFNIDGTVPNHGKFLAKELIKYPYPLLYKDDI